MKTILKIYFILLSIMTVDLFFKCNDTPAPKDGKDGVGIDDVQYTADSLGTEARFSKTNGEYTGWIFIPAGPKGDKGAKGDKGDPGELAEPCTTWVYPMFRHMQKTIDSLELVIEAKMDSTAKAINGMILDSLMERTDLWKDSLTLIFSIKKPLTPVGYCQTSYRDSDGLRIYVLAGDSILLGINPAFIDIDGNAVDSLLFHITVDSAGHGRTLKWTEYYHPGDTIDIPIKGLPMGGSRIDVRQGKYKDERWMSAFYYSDESGWKVLRVK
jgi:hypothetical protein